MLQRQEKELIDYNDKMDALPWKHKIENDKQTDMLLEALQGHSQILNNNQAEALKDLNITIGHVMDFLQLQPKQSEQRAISLIQKIEKQMVFIATTAASNINDRLDRITSTQFEQFAHKIDAFALSQKVDWHNTLTQECAGQNTVAIIEGRLTDSLLELKNLSSAVTELTFQSEAHSTKSQQLNEILAKTLQSAMMEALDAQTKQVKKMEKHFENKTLSTNDALQALQTNLDKLYDHAQQHGETIKKNISSNSALLQKYGEKLKECLERGDLLMDKQANNSREFHKNVGEQLTESANITHGFLIDLLNRTDKAPECDKSIAVVDDIKNITADIISKLVDLANKSDSNTLLSAMKTVEELTDSLNANIALSFGRLFDEMGTLQTLEELAKQTNDGVQDTKRRVEYGVHQVSTEVSKLIKAQTKELGSALETRFNTLETSLLDEDEGILANLTGKVIQEVNQVWKQIGTMHQQMFNTNELINSLQNQANLFANGTVYTMDNMKGKVGIITSRVIEMGSNLNVLLGRISLISQEFNQIKKGLGNTLDEMKRSFQTVQNRMKPTGPGPYPVNQS